MGDQNLTGTLSEADLEDARKLDEKMVRAFSNRDLEAAMDCFWIDPGLVVVLNGEVHHGADEVRASIKEMFEHNESIKLELDNVTHVVTGDGMIGVGTAAFTLKPVGQPRRLMVERWSDVRKKIDGRWVYVLDHTTHLQNDVIPEDESSSG